MKKIQLTILASAITFAFTAGSALAGTATANIPVSANVDASCTIAATPVAFGAYNPTSATDLYSTGTVTIACVKGSTPVVSLSNGLNPGAIAGERSMKHATAADLINYVLYKPTSTAPNAACSTNASDVWATDPAQRFTPTGFALTGSTYNVCGKVIAGQDVQAGAYSDTVIATVEF